MDNEVVASGFWSYARADDDRERGRITRLRTLICEEFETLTGTSIDIFLDREAIKWGQDFRQELDAALQRTTFFIPVLTPTYFLREECRRELRNFVSAAAALGLEELLLSIRYSPVDDLREDSVDELKSIAARMQFEPWEDLRLVDEDSAPYRMGVNRLARRLVERTSALESRPTTAAGSPGLNFESQLFTGASRSAGAEETRPGESDDDEPGYLELMADFGPATQDWQATIEEFPQALGVFNGLFNEATESISRADTKPNSFAAKVSIARKLARDLDAPVSEIESISKQYLSGLLRLDPIIRALLTAVPLQSDAASARATAESVRDLIDVARTAMESVEGSAAAAKRQEGVSRDLRPLLRRFQAAMRNFVDGQEVFDGWIPLVERALEEPDSQ